jgi:hypothetical protein
MFFAENGRICTFPMQRSQILILIVVGQPSAFPMQYNLKKKAHPKGSGSNQLTFSSGLECRGMCQFKLSRSIESASDSLFSYSTWRITSLRSPSVLERLLIVSCFSSAFWHPLHTIANVCITAPDVGSDFRAE